MAGFVQNVSFQSPEMEAIARRQKLAEALQAQSQQPIQSAAPNAPISWTQGLAKMMQAYTARRDLDKAESERKALVDQTNQRNSADTALLAQALQGREVRPAGLEGDVAGNIYQQDALPAQTPVQSLGQAIPMMGPQMQGPALNLMAQYAPKRPEPFTMKPGEVRYDETGKPMAFGMPEKPPSAEPFNLSPGQTRYDASGKPIVSAPEKPESQIPVTPIDLVDEKTGRVYKVDARTGRRLGLSPADTKLTGAFNADTATLQGTTASMDRLATAANQLLQHPGLEGITGVRGKFPNIPGGTAADAQALLNTLKSQVAFGVLQDMRNTSKTGGALGNVSDAEGRRLEANLAALENSQSADQMKRSLSQIIEYTETAKDRMREAFNMKHGGPGGLPTTPGKQPYAGPERRATTQQPAQAEKPKVKWNDLGH